MMTRTPDTGWMDQATCLNHADLGWIKEPHQVGPTEEARMAGICGRCPVFVSCSTYAGATDATAGFWAGSFWTPQWPLLPITGDAA